MGRNLAISAVNGYTFNIQATKKLIIMTKLTRLGLEFLLIIMVKLYPKGTALY